MLYQVFPTIAFKEVQNEREYRSYWRMYSTPITLLKNTNGVKMQKLMLEGNKVGLLLSNDVYYITNGNVQFDCFWILLKDEQFFVPTDKVTPCKETPTKGSQ